MTLFSPKFFSAGGGHRRSLGLGLGLLVSALVAQAQITFAINATPTADALGYVTGQSYNFTYTLNTASNTGNGAFQPGSATAGSNYTWLQEWTVDPQIWTSITGDGLAGTWVEPGSGGSNNPAPYSELIASVGSPGLTLRGGADSTYNVGLTATGLPVKFILFQANFTGLDFSPVTGTLPDPNVYFAGYQNSYAASSSIQGWIHTSDGSNAFFTVNSLTVAGSAVPEPSTYAAMAGATMLVFACWRRRQRAVPPAAG